MKRKGGAEAPKEVLNFNQHPLGVGSVAMEAFDLLLKDQRLQHS